MSQSEGKCSSLQPCFHCCSSRLRPISSDFHPITSLTHTAARSHLCWAITRQASASALLVSTVLHSHFTGPSSQIVKVGLCCLSLEISFIFFVIYFLCPFSHILCPLCPQEMSLGFAGSCNIHSGTQSGKV